MCSLPNTDRSVSFSETSWEDGDSQISITNKQFYEDLIRKADNFPIPDILKFYGIRIDQYNKQICCPLPRHKSGREQTASFHYYPETNTFWCFGCKTGVNGTILVSNIDAISRAKAAFRIINVIGPNHDFTEENSLNVINSSERNDLLFDFSETIRNFIHSNLDNSDKVKYAETLTAVLDRMQTKYQLDITALTAIINKLKNKLIGR